MITRLSENIREVADWCNSEFSIINHIQNSIGIRREVSFRNRIII